MKIGFSEGNRGFLGRILVNNEEKEKEEIKNRKGEVFIVLN